ncbi:MAG: glycosyltransferase family 2 protein [Bacteroidales bacterium]|nr:glycosyltransferase family 2 protein [Bacteroidales bacterium]
MQPSISVIITLYNAERWLQRCLSSLSEQSFHNLEIILIDDGSVDGSGVLCDTFADNDKRAKVFHTPNQGISEARQFGLEQATGDYLIFLDADDYISPVMYEELYHAANTTNADLVFCDWISIEGAYAFSDSLPIKKWDAHTLLTKFLYNQPVFLWNVLIRRVLFDRLSVSFPKGRLNYGEDTIVMIEILANSLLSGYSLQIVHVPQNLYFYDKSINSDSLMKPPAKVMNQSQIRVWEIIGTVIDTQKYGRYYYGRFVSYLFGAFWNNLYDPSEYKQFSHYLKPVLRLAPFNSKKILVVLLLSGRFYLARLFRIISFPSIIREKIVLAQRSKKGKLIASPSH